MLFVAEISSRAGRTIRTSSWSALQSGDFVWQWMPGDGRPAGEELTAVWAEGCGVVPGQEGNDSGVGLGQFLVVTGAFVVVRALSRWPESGRARALLLYAIGSIAAYWSFGRIFAIVAP